MLMILKIGLYIRNLILLEKATPRMLNVIACEFENGIEKILAISTNTVLVAIDIIALE